MKAIPANLDTANIVDQDVDNAKAKEKKGKFKTNQCTLLCAFS